MKNLNQKQYKKHYKKLYKEIKNTDINEITGIIYLLFDVIYESIQIHRELTNNQLDDFCNCLVSFSQLINTFKTGYYLVEKDMKEYAKFLNMLVKEVCRIPEDIIFGEGWIKHDDN